jgi:RNA polymerase sigma-70 factor (ECF subfamily)
MEKARHGDTTAYGRLVRAHETVAFRTACLITGDAQEAEDAAQEAFVKAYRSLDHFRKDAAFRPWLLAIVANEAKNRRKAAGRRSGLVLRLADHEGSPDTPCPGSSGSSEIPEGSPEAELLAGERRAELLESVRGLRERDRLALACRYFLGLSEEETAAALGCARGTVKSRLSRALDRLRKEMAQKQPEQTEEQAREHHAG